MKHGVLVLGGGVGGTRVANALARKGVPVTVVDSHGDHLYQPGYLYLAFGIEFELARPGRSLLADGIEYAVDRAARIDSTARRVRFESGRELPYDILVIATGSRVDREAIPSLEESAHHFHCRYGAEELRDALALFEGGKIVVGAARLPYKCPPSPVEFALLLEEELRKRGTRCEITYVYPHARVLTQERVADAAEALFAKRGIRTVTPFVAASADPGRRELRATDGRVLPYDLLVLVPPHCGAPFLAGTGLAGPGNWVRVDPRTLRASDGIYALGDAADLPVPKSGAAAHFQSEVVAENVLAELRGAPPAASYDGRVQCFCETGEGRALKIEFTYDRPPDRPVPSTLAHVQKELLNRNYFHLVQRGWI